MDEKTFLSGLLVALLGVVILFIGVIPAFFGGETSVPLVIFGVAILIGSGIGLSASSKNSA